MQRKYEKLSTIYSLYFFIIYVVYVAILLILLRGRNPAFAIDSATIVMPAIEVGFFCMLGLFAMRISRGRSSLIAIVVLISSPLLVVFVYLAQMYSAYISGNYISVLALENIASGQYVTKPSFFFFAALAFGSWVWLFLAISKARKHDEIYLFGKGFVFSFVAMCLLFVGMFNSSSGPERIVQLRPDMVPVTSLARKFRDLYDARNSMADMTQVLGEQGIVLPNNEHFPLRRKKAYSADLLFQETKKTINQPNVIVVFAEGLSARFLQTYGGKHPGLMPNVDRFALQSMVVDNYFSHTAATFRGIQGQLVSGYPRNGGTEHGGWTAAGEDNTAQLTSINYQTIPDILLARGYRTAFLSSSPEGNSFNTMLRSLGFETVYTVETLPQLLGGRKTPLNSGTKDAADSAIFAGLKGFLEQQAQSGNAQPFFVGTYNVGTHAFLDSDSAGITYGAGDNPALNRMHNFDAQLGMFLEYFQKSSFSENTLLIITTDHATYPEPAVVEALQDKDYRAYFVDRIPLIIYDKRFQLPTTFDAGYRTSVDFAPTLLHLISLQEVDNAFMGYSIFEQPPKYHAPVAAIGNDFYFMTPQGIMRASEMERADERYRAYENYVKMYYWLEFTNRVFPAHP